MARTSIKLSFDNGRGQKIAAILDTPVETPRHYGIFGPCFTCPKESHAAAKVCRALAESGIAMLRIDVTGTGMSEGDPAASTFTGRIDDFIAAAAFLSASYKAPEVFIGHSISGTAGLSAARRIASLRVIATIGSPADTETILSKFRRNGDIAEHADGSADMNVLGTIHRFGAGFLQDMEKQTVAEDTAALRQKAFIFHAPNDRIVHADSAARIAARAGDRATVVMLDDDATHLFENRNDDALQVAETIAGWLRDNPA